MLALRESAERADAIRGELAAELDRHEGAALGFDMAIDHETGPGALWLYIIEYGEPEHLARFVLRCAEAFNLRGRWGFSWGLNCTKPLTDGFGGGALVLDLGRRETIAWIDCADWLAEHTRDAAGDATSPEAVA
jgi:hypothetical protein